MMTTFCRWMEIIFTYDGPNDTRCKLDIDDDIGPSIASVMILSFSFTITHPPGGRYKQSKRHWRCRRLVHDPLHTTSGGDSLVTPAQQSRICGLYQQVELHSFRETSGTARQWQQWELGDRRSNSGDAPGLAGLQTTLEVCLDAWPGFVGYGHHWISAWALKLRIWIKR